jgi:hypothetical protein
VSLSVLKSPFQMVKYGAVSICAKELKPMSAQALNNVMNSSANMQMRAIWIISSPFTKSRQA